MERLSPIGELSWVDSLPEDPFEPDEVPYAWGAPRSEDSPPPPSFTPEEARNTAEPVPHPLQLADSRMRHQLSSADTRADRLVRQVRSDVEQLKQTLDALSHERDDMLQLDVAALIADPEQATKLPPAVLVRAIIATAEANESLRAEAEGQRKKAAKLRRELRDLRLEAGAREIRLETLEQVIAALHANLEDLRIDRDRARVASPAGQQSLRPGYYGQLPPPPTGIASCD